ncbi:MAG: hypothetical protein AUG46_01830 [Acidobacteria bacterium 13_1_20CM_3_58_11]|nr:MAG: hypothetical protein AUG46_01830 [Acidobacteria bacterium 13_1_20CM_3_58_11]
MVDVFRLRLFVVVRFLDNRFTVNTFPLVAAHATLFVILNMPRTPPSLAILLLLPLRLFLQTATPTAAAPVLQPACGQKLHVAGIPNAGKITDLLYRGAQPKEVGLSELKMLGINTIVDLRAEDPKKVAWERKHAESLGIRFVHIPVTGWSPPTNEQIIQFLSLLRSAPGHKIFVHCRLGEDRTGVFIATYRMAFEKWPAEQALKEMYFFGFNGFWHPAMKSFIRDFPGRLASAPALAPVRTLTSQPGCAGASGTSPPSSAKPCSVITSSES